MSAVMTVRKPGVRMVRVFIIDDERLIAHTLEVILCRSGFDATAFTNADQLLHNLMLLRPAALITDIDMGAINGLQLAATVTTLLPTCKIMVISGRIDSGEWSRDLDSVLWPILMKPVHPLVLLDKLHSLLQPPALASLS